MADDQERKDDVAPLLAKDIALMKLEGKGKKNRIMTADVLQAAQQTLKKIGQSTPMVLWLRVQFPLLSATKVMKFRRHLTINEVIERIAGKFAVIGTKHCYLSKFPSAGCIMEGGKALAEFDLENHTQVFFGHLSSDGKDVEGPLVFERPLTEVLYREGTDVPYLVTSLTAFLESTSGVLQTGVFRLSGEPAVLAEVRSAYNSGLVVDLKRLCTDAFSAAVLIKEFLRDMPEPLFPAALTPELHVLAEKSGGGKGIPHEALIPILTKMPGHNIDLLCFLAFFLKRVCDHSADNKMPVSNIAVVFGPNVFRCPGAGPVAELALASIAVPLTEIIITNVEKIAMALGRSSFAGGAHAPFVPAPIRDDLDTGEEGEVAADDKAEGARARATT